jgi:uncharacterized protein
LRGRAGDTIKGLQLLETTGVPFRVTTVVTDRNVASLDKLVLLLAGFRQARGIGLDLLVAKGRAASGGNCRPPAPEDLVLALKAMATCLVQVNRHRVKPLRLREKDLVAAALTGRKRQPFCQAAAGRALAVAPDGRLFACSQTLGDQRFAAGTVWEPRPERLGLPRDLVLQSASCGDCPLAGCCPGDCPSRLFYNRQSGSDHQLACALYRALLPPARNNHDSRMD